MNFVIIDTDQKLPEGQKAVVQKYFRGYIPHVVVIDRFGKALYDDAGEVEESIIAKYLDKALSK
ncbi:MAG: hypothetical protein HYX28_07625 [Candidatus Koribacter versatilis]|uniref:Uncharacterized protein n=1 Tax=Candidatus Korobacter versatilis TaxID=658062 RepID=A0A932A8W2_9BACT|nr:hypothetical protein [Candidatus Koribacter versatilis]